MLTFTGPTTGTTFSLPIDVRKAKPEVKVRTKPGRIVAGQDPRPREDQGHGPRASKVTGKVIVKVGGKKYKAKLKKGKAFIRLDRFAKTGKKRSR